MGQLGGWVGQSVDPQGESVVHLADKKVVLGDQ